MKTVTAKAKAYIGQHSTVGPQDLAEGKRLDDLIFYSGGSDMTKHGWTLVGDAEITVEIPDPQSLVDNKIAALREEVKKTRAEAEVRVMGLERQIQDLLAIEYQPQQ